MKKLLLFFYSAIALTLAGAVTTEQLNREFGVALFCKSGNWNLPEFRKQSGLPLTGTAGRYAARMRRNVAGAMAEEVVIYTEKNDSAISRISIVFANKGDTSGRYQSKIKEDNRTISNLLTRNCGPKQRSNFFTGQTRIKADRWKTPFADIYLEISKKEFLMLHIVPPRGKAALSGKTTGNYSKNVVRNDFEDVYIKNIPMVDQGQKGYCVPATMERIFSYFGVNLDMHHIAEIGNTQRGGGTYVDKMLRDIASLRRKSGLKQSKFTSLSLKNIARHIDKGYPVAWVMFSTDELMQLYIFSRRNRSQEKSPLNWAKKIRKINLPKSEKGPHICLIIGYNHTTGEIGVSNSWGQAHIAPIWIPVKAAKKVSQNILLVFYP